MSARHLNNKMKQFCELEIQKPTEHISTLAKEFGITKRTAYSYTANIEYKEYKEKLLKEIWKDYEKMAVSNIKKIANNDQDASNALKANLYILDSLGYKAPEQVELKTDIIKVTLDETSEEDKN